MNITLTRDDKVGFNENKPDRRYSSGLPPRKPKLRQANLARRQPSTRPLNRGQLSMNKSIKSKNKCNNTKFSFSIITSKILGFESS